jgi:hypothetical protein
VSICHRRFGLHIQHSVSGKTRFQWDTQQQTQNRTVSLLLRILLLVAEGLPDSELVVQQREAFRILCRNIGR